MALNIPEEFEQTPHLHIDRADGTVLYFFRHKEDPFRSLPVVNGEIIDWTKLFQAHMDSPDYPKK